VSGVDLLRFGAKIVAVERIYVSLVWKISRIKIFYKIF